MQVKATDVGFDNLVLRQPGEVFEMPDGSEGTWFKPVGNGKGGNKGQFQKKGEKPDTGNGDDGTAQT